MALSSADWSSQAAPAVRAMTRLIVVPFRLLRPDPDVDFLAFSLADAVATSLAGLQSMVVRSTAAAAHDAGAAPDLKRLAQDADVDVVLFGTVLRAGDQLRVATQLVEAPGGTVVWSHTAQVTMGDIFRLQDDLAHRIVESLSVPLTAREQRLLRHDVPATARAYEFYLRANQLSLDTRSWTVAREVYRQCLSEDPGYAPAWARLGRVCRVLAKWGGTGDRSREWQLEAEEALQRALELNPDLPLAHHLAALMDIDGGNAERAMVRLIERTTQAADPQLLAGLVQACRYCGLLAASLEAHEQALRLDKTQLTTGIHTLWATGDFARTMEQADTETLGYMRPVLLVSMGRLDEAREHLSQLAAQPVDVGVRRWHAAIGAAIDGRAVECVEACEGIVGSNVRDPEALYHVARLLAHCGREQRAVELFNRSVDEGYFNVDLFARDPWLDPLRSDPAFDTIVARADARHRHARDAFEQAGGHRLLALAKQVS